MCPVSMKLATSVMAAAYVPTSRSRAPRALAPWLASTTHPATTLPTNMPPPAAMHLGFTKLHMTSCGSDCSRVCKLVQMGAAAGHVESDAGQHACCMYAEQDVAEVVVEHGTCSLN